MSKSFVKPPVEDRMIDEDGYLTDSWREWYLDTWQSSDELANEAGLQVPNLTGLQRLGQIIPSEIKPLVDTGRILKGFIVYQTDSYDRQETPLPDPPVTYAAGYYYWDGSAWVHLT